MELEFEGIFRRGIFVTKRAAKEGAKKKYALVDEQGKLKVVGFELVRRDVAAIAKKTQESVLEAVLRENDPKKAVAIVRKAVEDLRAGRVPLEDLVIYTQLKKGLSRYAAIGPHVAAVQKAVKEGAVIETGTIIGFVVTKGTGSISERSYLAERVGDRRPDPEYYINNQVIPSVIRILGELGYSEEDLLGGKKQKGLGEWA
jgi:DNA polymerase I